MNTRTSLPLNLRSRLHLVTLSPCHLVILLTLFFASCQSTPAPTPVSKAPAPFPSQPDALALATDPCALRLQDIAGALALYCNGQSFLPLYLEDLRPAAARLNLQLDFTCPVSGRPYIYVPANGGLSAPGQERRLIIYDAAPVHDGCRWGIVILPAHGLQPFTAEVIRLDPTVFKIYFSSSQAAP